MLYSNLPAQTVWEKHLSNPIFSDSTLDWNDGGAFGPCVLFDGAIYHMWYMGYDGNYTRIGYATSSDGLHWSAYENNPVLDVGSPGSWDESWITYPYVIYDDTTFHMWYSGVQGTVPGPSHLWKERIGYATSPDGITWTKYENNPVLDIGTPGAWDDHNIDVGSVYFDGETYHLWYGGSKADLIIRTGCATSADGINWTRYENNPVLGLGDWDHTRVHQARIIFDGEHYHMFYGGGDYFTWRIGHATSINGISWEKDPDNPVLNVGESGSWEDYYVAVPSVMIDTVNSKYRMWYTGGRGELQGEIGYAESSIETSMNDNVLIDIPQKFVLFQNYPNPFNPSTTIEFTLPKSEFVELKVYNILGKKVSTLVSKKLNQGNHTYTFVGNNLASGVYYYRLEAENFTQTRKMIYLK